MTRSTRTATAALLSVMVVHLSAGGVAERPPMGWNSWDCYGTTVTEAEVKANAGYMAKHLKAHGWQYVVVDIQWSERQPKSHGYRDDADLAMDSNGRLIPAVNRFPSAANGAGFERLANYVHGLGLKFGIHIMRGIPRRAVERNLPVADSRVSAAAIADTASTCTWNKDMYGVDMTRPGAQDYYDSIVKMYAAWGVDYIKADDMARPPAHAEIAALHRAIAKTGRDIVLSLSPGPAMVKDLEFFRDNANLWRVSDDFWDEWRALRQSFTLLSVWSGVGRPGAWPDADMLPLGRIGIRAERGDDRMTRFTYDEQRTLMTLWSIAQSPLMFGGDLPSNDEFTLGLLTNDEVLAVDQRGRAGTVVRDGGGPVWVAASETPGKKYVALFNAGDRAAEVHVEWSWAGLPRRCAVRDLWEHRDLGEAEAGLTVKLPAHGAGLYAVRAIPRPAR